MTLNIIANKLGMTKIFDEKNREIPITVLKVHEGVITLIKKKKTGNFDFIQLGYLSKEKNKKILSKPEKGHLMAKNLPLFGLLKEYKIHKKNSEDYFLGKAINLLLFNIGETVDISGKTIGKGTAGNIKKNHFKRGPMAHGSKHHRLQGSLGAGTSPGRVFPGKKMPGRLGYRDNKIFNLKIIDIDYDQNLLFLKGSVPGKKNNFILIKKSKQII